MNPLAMFTGPYALLAKWGVIALLVAAFGSFCWVKGDEHGTDKLIAYQGQQAIATVKLTAAREKIVTVTETKYRDRIQTVYVQGETIENEVTKYVTPADDAAYPVPVGFVREFNAAWSGTAPGPAGESDRRPSGVPLSAVAETDAFNATSCRAYKEQRDGLIEFYGKLRATLDDWSHSLK